jgi:electron transfer flavoprotein beta subunit
LEYYAVPTKILDLCSQSHRDFSYATFAEYVMNATVEKASQDVKDINEPRLPSLLGIKKAAKAQIPTLTAKDIGADENKIGLKGSPTWVMRVFSPEARGGSGEILKGELTDVVPLLVNKLMDTKFIK